MGEKKAVVMELLARLARKSPEEIREDMELVADLGLDSPKALELLVELEESLSIEIDDAAASGMNTVGDVLGLVDSVG
ncbi:MAG: phosphopantetheine-binding protein [Planctomycetota bacterium]